MAEINVERKKNVLPWIVGLIVLVLAIWGVMALMNTDERRTYDPALGTTTEPVSPVVQQPATQQPMPATAPADTGVTGDAATTGDAGDDAADRTTPPPPPQQ